MVFRPHRVQRLILAAGSFTRRDPTLFVFCFALWALCNGFSLLMSADTFSRTPVYSVAKDLNLPDNAVGVLMLLNGLVLTYALGRCSYITRAAILWATGLIWIFWSVLMFLGGLRAGLYSSAAVWTFLSGFILITMAGTLWREG